MTDHSLLPFSLPSVERKKITAAFDGGRISSDGGVMLLALAERRMGIAARLAAEIIDQRDPTRIVHGLSVYKSALELSDSVRCNERQSAIMMVRRCMADLKPGIFDAPLRGCGA